MTKIVSPDGLVANTEILTDDGHRVEGVLSAQVTIEPEAGVLVAYLIVRLSSCNIVVQDGHIEVVSLSKKEKDDSK